MKASIQQKTSHSGMNPDYLQLAKKEWEELLEFDLIKPSDSQWGILCQQKS